MKAKKIIGLCLAAALVIGMVGCQSGSKESEGSNVQTEASSEKITLKIGQTNFAAHGTKAFALVTAVVSGDEIVDAYLDEFQYMNADSAQGIVNSEGMADNIVEGKVLASKVENNESYSKTIAEKAGSTVMYADNFAAIQNFVKGKKISELEDLVNNKTNEEVTDAVTGATLVDTSGYIKAILEAAKQAERTTGVEFDGNVEDLKLSQTYFAAHGTKSFAVASALTDKDKVVLSYIDEYQFMATDGAIGVANSTEGLAENVVEGKVLASKRQNSDNYSATMAEKAGSTVKFADNLNAIQAFVDGKTLTELEEIISKTNEEVTDAVSGATLADTAGYINAVIQAAKSAQ